MSEETGRDHHDVSFNYDASALWIDPWEGERRIRRHLSNIKLQEEKMQIKEVYAHLIKKMNLQIPTLYCHPLTPR